MMAQGSPSRRQQPQAPRPQFHLGLTVIAERKTQMHDSGAQTGASRRATAGLSGGFTSPDSGRPEGRKAVRGSPNTVYWET